MSKTVRIVLEKDAREAYLSLQAVTKEEKDRGMSNSENQQLLRSIDQKVGLLKVNPASGIKISKKLYPKEYAGLTNLWKVNLTRYWRMLYTLQSSEVEIVGFILEIIDHEKYDKLFGYRKK